MHTTLGVCIAHDLVGVDIDIPTAIKPNRKSRQAINHKPLNSRLRKRSLHGAIVIRRIGHGPASRRNDQQKVWDRSCGGGPPLFGYRA